VARALSVTTRAVGQLLSRQLPADAAALCATRASFPAFPRLLSTYAAVKLQMDGAVGSLNARKGDKFSLYPLDLVARLLGAQSAGKVDAALLQAVQTFVKENEVASAAAAASDSKGASSSAAAGAAAAEEIKVKLEPQASILPRASRRALPVASFAAGGIPVIDLTDPATLAALDRLEDEDKEQEQHATAAAACDVEQTLSSLVDNFALWQPVQAEYAVLREYGLRADEVAESPRLQEQCQRFSEYRQEIWNWHRDPSQVTPRTVGNNIRVFLLFGGFLCHTTKRHRLKQAAFDMSVFGSPHIEDHVMGFLHYLHGSRGLMFSSIANYLNSLAVLAKFYFVDNPLADVSFSAERVDSEFVLAGLRRVRAQTNAKAKSETRQKPLHAQWLSWPECQQVRRACQAAFLKADSVGSSKNDKKALRLLKSLVCLYFYTIAPPPRCSIVRLLQWRTTLVKKRADPSRYVIDLLNNPDAPASQHKVCGAVSALFPLYSIDLCCGVQTVKYYRRAILPLPKSMTPYLDQLRMLRKHSGTADNWVFVNSRGEPYTTSTCGFASRPRCPCVFLTRHLLSQRPGRTLSSRPSPSTAPAPPAEAPARARLPAPRWPAPSSSRGSTACPTTRTTRTS
jgi:hypothetical protein